MVEPVTTTAAAAAATGATGAAGSAGAAGAVGAAGGAGAAGAAAPLPSDGGFLSGITDFITAPFRWVASLPGKIFGAAWGAVKGAFNFGNLPVALVVAGAETAVTLASPETAVSARVLAGMNEEEARRAVADIAKDGVTGVALNAAGHGAIVAGLLGGASGASEGAGGGVTGLLAGAAVVVGGVAAASHFLSPSATPVANTGGRNAGEARNT